MLRNAFRTLAAVLTAAALCHPASAADGFGTIKGTFVLQGAAPALKPLVTKGEPVADKAVCAADAVPNQSVVVGAGGGLANVFIYLPKVDEDEIAPALKAAPKTAVEIDQAGCVFKPHAFMVRVDQPIKLLNSDPVAHNVHTYPFRNPAINVLIGGNEKKGVPTTMTKPEIVPVPVKCDIHNWMEAFVLVVDHPYAAVSGDDGTFEIKDLPAGKHTFRIWHEAAGYLERSYDVTVKAGETTDLGKIKVEAAKLEKK